MDPVIENRDLVNQIHLISYLSSAPRWCAAPGREVRAACRSPHLAGWPLASPLPSPAPRFAPSPVQPRSRLQCRLGGWVLASWVPAPACLPLPTTVVAPGPRPGGQSLVAPRASSVRRRRLPPLPPGCPRIPDAAMPMRRCAIWMGLGSGFTASV